MFIRQSIRSDYCAIYSVGMCLTIAGHPTNRQQAMAMFDARRGKWAGASQAQIRNVLAARIVDLRSKWQRFSSTNQNSIHGALRRALRPGRMALVTAYCKHRTLGITCGHVFLATGIRSDGSIEILDPLCKKPKTGTLWNASIPPACLEDGDLLLVRDSPWDICLKHQVSILRVPRAASSGLSF